MRGNSLLVHLLPPSTLGPPERERHAGDGMQPALTHTYVLHCTVTYSLRGPENDKIACILRWPYSLLLSWDGFRVCTRSLAGYGAGGQHFAWGCYNKITPAFPFAVSTPADKPRRGVGCG